MSTDPEAVAESMEVCGLEGAEQEPPTRYEVNHLLRRAIFYHLRPMKRADEKNLKAITSLEERHERLEQAFMAMQNQIQGAKWALYTLCGLLAFLFPVLFKIIELMKILAK